MKLLVLALIFVATDIHHGAVVNSSPCGDNSWTPYKDEKCVKLFKSLVNRRQAQERCNDQLSYTSLPSLVIIRSPAEQLFLNEYVFNSSVDISVWIGAERRPDSTTEFDWIDGSPVERFTNWAVGHPTNNMGRPCVQMRSQNSRQLSDMEWTDISCSGGTWFICEKLQAWPIEQFQRSLLSTRRDLQHLVEDLTTLLVDMRSELTSETTNRRSDITAVRSELAGETTNRRNDITSVRSELTTTRNTVTTLQANPVPVGFIYVQLSGQPEPRTIWGTVTWTEVTSQYAGLFFRAVGGGSAAFGSEQGELCPRLTRIQRGQNSVASDTLTTVPSNGWTQMISTGASFSGTHSGLWFEVSGGEVRPRNSAIRIWRRSS